MSTPPRAPKPQIKTNKNKLSTLQSLGTLLMFFFLLVIGYTVDTWYKTFLLSKQRSLIAEDDSELGNTLSIVINRRLSLVESLGAFVEAELEFSEIGLGGKFEHLAQGLQKNTVGVRNFVIAPNGIQNYVYPLEGNELIVGHNLLQDERDGVRLAVEQAMQSREVTLSGPYGNLQKDLELIVLKAIYQGQTFWGLVAVTLELSPIFQKAGIEKISSQIRIALLEPPNHILYGKLDIFENDPVVFDIALPNGIWRLAGIPTGVGITPFERICFFSDLL